MNKLVNFISFTAGAAIGSLVTWKLIKTRYEQIAKEEIDSIKELYSSKVKNDYEDNEPEHSDDVGEENYSSKKQKIEEYKQKLDDYRYKDYEGSSVRIEDSKPHVITPDEFGEIDDYDTTTLYYYQDDTMVDDQEEIVENYVGIVGHEFRNRFGEFTEDAVYVRNDFTKTDYEILLDIRNYEDVKRDLIDPQLELINGVSE